MKVLAIARLTFSVERHRPEILILVLMGFLLAFSMSMISLSPGATEQILGSDQSSGRNNLMLQGGLFYSEIFLYLVGFLVAMNSIWGDRKTAIMDIVLSKQLTRTQYLLGKFLGAFFLCSTAYIIMILPILGLTVFSGHWGALVSTALSYFFGCVKIVIFLSLTFFLLMRLPRLVAPLIGLLFVTLGYFSQELSLRLSESVGVIHWLSMISYYMIPHLTEVTVATIFDPVARSGPAYVKWFVVYGLFYPAIFVFLSLTLFKRRSL